MRDKLGELIARQNLTLQYEKSQKGGALVITCHGAFSLVNHVPLDEMTEDARNTSASRIVLNLLDVSHMDSIGIGTLAMILKHVMNTGKDLVLVPNDTVRHTLKAASLETAFIQADSLEAALGPLNRPAGS